MRIFNKNIHYSGNAATAIKILKILTLLALGTNFESARPAHIRIRRVHDLVKNMYWIYGYIYIPSQQSFSRSNSILKLVALYT